MIYRFDPYRKFKFRVRWDGRYVAGVSKVSALTRTTEVVEFREGGDSNSVRRSPGQSKFAPITLERGVTHDLDANGNSVAIQSLTLQNEGWERNLAVVEPVEPSFELPAD